MEHLKRFKMAKSKNECNWFIHRLFLKIIPAIRQYRNVSAHYIPEKRADLTF
jgi:hypothetical protein